MLACLQRPTEPVHLLRLRASYAVRRVITASTAPSCYLQTSPHALRASWIVSSIWCSLRANSTPGLDVLPSGLGLLPLQTLALLENEHAVCRLRLLLRNPCCVSGCLLLLSESLSGEVLRPQSISGNGSLSRLLYCIEGPTCDISCFSAS